jgi:cytochrome c-type biogenesis protein CcmH
MTRSSARGLLAALVVALPTATLAVEPDEVLADAALEARARELSAGLRCLVCQNQSIDDSDAPLAKDLRVLVRERLKAGETDEQVRAFVVDRYGSYVLLEPPFSWSTLMLWLMPLIALGGAAWAVTRGLRAQSRRAANAVSPKLTREEEERLKAILVRSRDE